MPTVFNHSGNTIDNSDGFSMVELAVSRDLMHWERVGNRQKFLPLSPVEDGKNYDTGQLLAANMPLRQNNELWFYYSGLKWRTHPDYLTSHKEVDHPDGGAICLAKLRLDGFVSLDAGRTEGYVLTQPLILDGKTLHLNLDAPHGEVRAEVLDADGKQVLSGFSRQDGIPMQADSLDAELRWKSGSDLSSLAGKPVRLRFSMRQARLYAFWLAN